MNDTTVLVGGGLANCLIAYRLHLLAPNRRILLVEREDKLGGNHTWCFHTSDVTRDQFEWLAPFIECSWSDYEIRFPELTRHLEGGYHCITSERLHAVMTDLLGDAVVYGAAVASVTSDTVELEDGRRFSDATVIDGRGDPGSRDLDVGYQKFVGRVVKLEAPHGLQSPILMDATVEQVDGFRFLYTLPLSKQRLLIEDTRYSEYPQLAREEMRTEIDAYAQAKGWSIERVEREEEGVLPVVMGGDLDAYWSAAPGVPRSGVRAGLFHYVTGYSLPEAVSLADALSERSNAASKEIYPFIRNRSRALWRRGRFYRILNRMMFRAAEPEQRYRVLQHFYRLPDDLVHRFYAGTTTMSDRVKILSGKPPVPIGRAIRSWFSRPATARESST
ncbi:MAG: lycopene beta-cyclase CrtY [Gammaproteobacteria bacterium]|nr:lycopene beta-cyclase CrtY [Gammaproteobacteria bacterium]